MAMSDRSVQRWNRMGKKKVGTGCEHEGITNADWGDSVLLSEVASHLGAKAKEIAGAFDHLESWDPFVRGFLQGTKSGLELAENLVQCMCDRVMGAESPFPSEPYPLGISNIL
jgi:hypothetical protein